MPPPIANAATADPVGLSHSNWVRQGQNSPSQFFLDRGITAVTVTFNGELIAATGAAILLRHAEGVLQTYIPLEDVTARLHRTGETSFCLWRGPAEYFCVISHGMRHPNAAWSYPAPDSTLASLSGLIAFDSRFTFAIG